MALAMASEDGEDCAMKYLKEQQHKPSVRKAKSRCETDAAMEYLKGQLAKKPMTGRNSAKVPLPDYLKGIRLHQPQTERSPEPPSRPVCSPGSPQVGTQVRDAYFSPGSDVRKTLELIQSKVVVPAARPVRSASAKRMRPPSPERSSPVWTSRSMRVVPGQSLPPSYRELREVREVEPARSVPAVPVSWVTTYARVLQSRAAPEEAPEESPNPGYRSARIREPNENAEAKEEKPKEEPASAPRAALTPCNFATPEKTPEKVEKAEPEEVKPQVPTWTGAVVRDVPERIQGISTTATTCGYTPITTPPMPLTPPQPARGDNWLRRHTASTSWVLPPGVQVAQGVSPNAGYVQGAPQVVPQAAVVPGIGQGVYRTYSVTTAVPWFPRTQRSRAPLRSASPLRRRQIKV